jgi:hypothetical protein
MAARSHDALADLIQAPPTARALSQPSFRLFHNIVSDVTKSTGFGLGLYTAEELKPEALATAEAKRTYVSKITGLVGVTLGAAVEPKPIADAILQGGGTQPLFGFLVSLTHAAKAGQQQLPRTSPTGGSGVPPPSSGRSTADRKSGRAGPGDSSSRGGRGTASSQPASRPSSATAASSGRRAEATGAGSAWSCAFCGHEHEQQLSYCELCAKIRGASKLGPDRAPPPRREPGGAAVGSSGSGSSSSRQGRPSRTAEEPPRRPAHRTHTPSSTAGSFFSGTAADRDADAREKRDQGAERAREAARAASGPRAGGRGGGRRAPAVEEWSDNDDDDDFLDAHIAGRWQKSKQEQAERDVKNRQAEEQRAAEATAAEDRRRAEARRAAKEDIARAAAVDAAWERFANLGDDARIRERDVPWPRLDAASLGFDTNAEKRKAAFRAASLRWHPDKFVQSFGGRLVEAEREAILQRVTEVAQVINSLYQDA